MSPWPIETFRANVVGFDKFILAFHQWIQDGMPKNKDTVFITSLGLCSNYTMFATSKLKLPANKVSEESLSTGFCHIMRTSYPFNSCGTDYESERHFGTLYMNSGRLDFINEAWKVINK